MNRQRLIDEFVELVKIDSETGFESEIAAVLKEKFTSLGLDVYEDRAAEATGHGAGNLICTWKGTKERADAIYFTSHMDTVVPGKAVEPQLDETYISSDGRTILGADDKAGIAAMLEAIRTINEEKREHGTVQFIITVGEESGLVGAKQLERERIVADYGYALDSDGSVGAMIVAAPAQAKLKAKVYGKTAHAGVEPEKGISAISVASKAVSKMPLGRIDSETTANIGRFEGGTQTNIVCDYVEITAEARSLERDKLTKQVEAMKKGFESAAAEMKTSCEVDVDLVYSGYKESEQAKVVQTAIHAFHALGLKTSLSASGGGSDANIIAGLGIPTINLAIGYEQIHTTNERIAIAELEKAAQAIVAIVDQASQVGN